MKWLFSFCLTWLCLSSLYAQSEWYLSKEKEQIEVYTREVEDSPLKEFKGVTELKAPLSAIVGVIRDVSRYTEWIPYAEEAKVLGNQGDSRMIYYVQTNTPWPAKDRDGVYQSHFYRDLESGVVHIDLTCLPEYLPAKENYVRIPSCQGGWQLEPLDDNRVRVIYQILTNPGGSLPSWLANMGAVHIPLTMLQELRKRAHWGEYQSKDYDFLK